MKRLSICLLVMNFVFFTSFVGCGGGGGGGGGGGAGSYKLFGSGITTDGVTSIGSVITDGAGNAILGFFKDNNTTALKLVIQKLTDGTTFVITVGDGSVAGQQEGYPYQLFFAGNTITFSNWTATTFDMAINYSDGSSETVTGVDYSELGDLSQDLNISLGRSSKFLGFDDISWGDVAKVSWTLVRLGTCGASIGAAAASGGVLLALAAVGCAGAVGEGIALSLNGIDAVTGWDGLTAVYETFVDGGDCAAVQSTGGTTAQQTACVNSSEDAASANTQYVDENGNAQTNDSGGGGGTTFAGGCTVGSSGLCYNYTGSGYTSSDAQQVCSSMGGTYISTACVTTGAVGACTTDPGGPAENQVVFYSPTFDASQAELICGATYNGVWSGTYTPPS
jgi:hypothetical protein